MFSNQSTHAREEIQLEFGQDYFEKPCSGV